MLILNELNGEYLAKWLNFFLKLFFASWGPDEREGKLRLPMGSERRPMVRAEVVLNVMEDRPFIFKVSDLGEIIGKLEGIYLRGLKRRRGKELGSVWRGCWAGWTLDKKKRGRGEVPSVPGFVVRGLPLAKKAAKVKCRWHDLRHTFVSRIAAGGAMLAIHRPQRRFAISWQTSFLS